MLFSKNDDGVRIWITAVKGGILQSGLAGSITVTVTDPDDSASTSPAVSAATQGGLYYADVASGFFTTNGLGHYVVVAEVNSGGVKDVIKDSLRIFEEDFDSISAGSGAALTDVQDTVVTAVEYQRGAHTAEVYLYVDPNSGSDANNGLTRANAKQTIANALAAVTQEHTAIIVLGAGTGQQVVTENITLSTRFTFLRGPGFDVRLVGASDASPTISITAAGCEVSGFEVTTPGTGTPDGISVTADFARLRRVRVLNSRQHGIDVNGGDRLRVEECIVDGAGASGTGNGIQLRNASEALITGRTTVNNSAGSNISIDPSGGAAVDNVIDDVTSTDAGTFGVSIAAGADDTQLTNLSLSHNTSGDVDDNGNNTIRHSTVLETYGGVVYVDPTGSAGKSYPLGTVQAPVNNLTEAFVIADGANINTFILLGDVTLPSARTDATFIGRGGETELDFNGQNLDGSTVQTLNLVGDAAGSDLVVEDCLINGVTNFKGRAFRTRLAGTISLNTGESRFISCASDEPGTASPILNVVGAGRTFNIRAYSGGIQVTNMTDAGNIGTIEFVAGAATVAASCTAGTLDIRGVGKPIVDNSAGTTVITTGYLNNAAIRLEIMSHVLEGNTLGYTLESAQNLIRKILNNRLALADGTTTNWVLYDDDDTTVLQTWDVADKTGATITQPVGAPSRRTRGS